MPINIKQINFREKLYKCLELFVGTNGTVRYKQVSTGCPESLSGVPLYFFKLFYLQELTFVSLTIETIIIWYG